MTTTTAAAADTGKLIERSRERRDEGQPRVPFRDQVKSLQMFDDNREFIVDRRVIAFMTPLKEAPEEGTIIGFKLAGAKPVVIRAPFAELKNWWLGSDAPGNS